MIRREFLLSAPFLGTLRAQGEPASFVYKKADGCDIKADVFGVAEKGSRPAAVWIHGGALINGSRKLAPKTAVLRSLLDTGFTVISIDYRLAPETKLPAIIEDVQDMPSAGYARRREFCTSIRSGSEYVAGRPGDISH